MSAYPASPKLAMYHSQPKPKRHAVLISRRSVLGFAVVLLVVYTLTHKAGAGSARQAAVPASYDRAIDTGAARVHPASVQQHDGVIDRLAGQAVVAGAAVGQGKRPLEFGRPGDIAPANPDAVAAVGGAANNAGPQALPPTAEDLKVKPRPGKLPPPPAPKKAAAGAGIPPPPPPGPTPGEQQVHEDLSGVADAPKPPPKGGLGKTRPLVKPAPDIPPPAPKPILPPLAKAGAPAAAPKKVADKPAMRPPTGYKAVDKAGKPAAAGVAGTGAGIVKAGAKAIAADDDKASEYAGHEELEDVEVEVEAAVEEEEALEDAEDAMDDDVDLTVDDDVPPLNDDKTVKAAAAALNNKDNATPTKPRPAANPADPFKVGDESSTSPFKAKADANLDNGNGVPIPPAPTNDPYDRVGEGDAAWGGLDAGKVATELPFEDFSTGEKVIQVVKEGAKELVGADRGRAAAGEGGKRVPMGLGAKKVGAWDDRR